jgi:hypothetical protein
MDASTLDDLSNQTAAYKCEGVISAAVVAHTCDTVCTRGGYTTVVTSNPRVFGNRSLIDAEQERDMSS